MPTPTPLPHTRVPTLLFPSAAAAARHVAREIAKAIRERTAAGRPTVLGLATGSTPVGLYRELIRLHKDEGLDFSKVVTFNLDEYYPMPREDSQSYFRFMHETFFNHVNVEWKNIHIPDGTVPPDEVERYCTEYERRIREAGGIDIQILGIGRTGHIGFNEPGSPRNSRTRPVILDAITRRDAASGFFGEENVPNQAVTMGVASIMDARRVFLMAFGEHKAPTVLKALERPPTEAVSASFLQEHPDATVVLDPAAAAELTAIKRPWEVGPCQWDAETVRRAVVHLALSVGKGLQMLNDDDFRDHHLYDLLRHKGPAERIGEAVFLDRLATIRPFPGGRVAREEERGGRGEEEANRHPSGSSSPLLPLSSSDDGGGPKTVLVFSPHPDDDVISMGGTIIRLVEQGHTVHIAYMTSGNVAVFDHDARRFADFVDEFNRAFGGPTGCDAVRHRIDEFLDKKRPGEADSPEVLRIKGLIRATEARAGALACGIPADQLEFMDLRFYRTGRARKDPIRQEDLDDIIALLRRLKPAQIYIAGELSDPHGTHRTCAEAVFAAVRQVRAGAEPWDFDVWLYKGAWEEWEPHEVEMAVPLSPDVLERKKQAIFRHQSQKDRAMFPGGTDRREFWQRAEDRNRGTARAYDKLGLPEYYALEAFVKWVDQQP